MKKETRPPRSSRKLQQQQLGLHAGSRIPVVVLLCNGTRLQGVVIALDDYLLLLGKDMQDTRPVVVYKHAIAMITQASAGGEALPAPETDTSPDFVPIYMPRKRRRR
ncbi:RNA chaperone Hfq [Cupriavidus pinatubonensis]|uniref:RNA-binding protein Hfq n=1 Tax=Cupriavidus pinatubonensis TaxID=248026 RepID=A0ABM8XFL5_9BURK|nr:RNA chaperone Hfq [Cupriavidus pinatubonensis]CAG9178923.1 RNA-binding protein Hfq [Cupriavidus pinatubonensis]